MAWSSERMSLRISIHRKKLAISGVGEGERGKHTQLESDDNVQQASKDSLENGLDLAQQVDDGLKVQSVDRASLEDENGNLGDDELEEELQVGLEGVEDSEESVAVNLGLINKLDLKGVSTRFSSSSTEKRGKTYR